MQNRRLQCPVARKLSFETTVGWDHGSKESHPKWWFQGSSASVASYFRWNKT